MNEHEEVHKTPKIVSNIACMYYGPFLLGRRTMDCIQYLNSGFPYKGEEHLTFILQWIWPLSDLLFEIHKAPWDGLVCEGTILALYWQ